MNKRRLLKLADFLETIPSRAFTIRFWEKRGATKPEGKSPGECGFAGCAMGWAAHEKLFRGLTIQYGTLVLTDKGGEVHHDFEAAAAVMDLGHDETRFLFSGLQYPAAVGEHYGNPTPRQVAKRIRKFITDPSIAASS